ncbi:hypothetical protein L596_021698 [Steinernema carpocapsae]|uniref:Uncharacterized protein n=1 Tax=Steinernema carpocapsae TaxID=34508 RepID=A0A4U5MJK8_STECR|nr:hypothetical protein L596_021698 [Steinernema carpocapsae]
MLDFKMKFECQNNVKNVTLNCKTSSRGIGWSQIHEGTRASGEIMVFCKKQRKSHVIKELLDLASFVCDNLTKKAAFFEKALTTDRKVTGHLI